MAIMLFLAGCAAVFVATFLFLFSETALHEIFAAIVGVAACILIGCAGIVDAVDTVAKGLKEKTADNAGSRP